MKLPRLVPWLVFAAGAALILLRPPVPLYWDEFVWLAKARLAYHGELWAQVVSQGSQLAPSGYPVLWPLLLGLTARLGPDALGSFAIASMVWMVALWGVFVVVLRWKSTARVWLAPALLLCAPLVLVHARSAYVDLPIGLLGACVALLAAPHASLPKPAASYAALGLLCAVLPLLKDEGVAPVLVVLFLARGRALPALLGIVSVILWRAFLFVHHVQNRDHTLDLVAAVEDPLAFVRTLRDLAYALMSWLSFGPLYLFALSAIRWRSVRDRESRAGFLAQFLLLWLGIVFFAVAFGPSRVREFSAHGTLWPRVFVQLAPLTAVWLSEVWHQDNAMR